MGLIKKLSNWFAEDCPEVETLRAGKLSSGMWVVVNGGTLGKVVSWTNKSMTYEIYSDTVQKTDGTYDKSAKGVKSTVPLDYFRAAPQNEVEQYL